MKIKSVDFPQALLSALVDGRLVVFAGAGPLPVPTPHGFHSHNPRVASGKELASATMPERIILLAPGQSMDSRFRGNEERGGNGFDGEAGTFPGLLIQDLDFASWLRIGRFASDGCAVGNISRKISVPQALPGR